MKVRYIKDYKGHKKGDTEEVTPNVGFGLVDSGVAIVDKMISESKVVKRASA